ISGLFNKEEEEENLGNVESEEDMKLENILHPDLTTEDLIAKTVSFSEPDEIELNEDENALKQSLENALAEENTDKLESGNVLTDEIQELDVI
ncbi:MAG: hypothetical protein ACKVJC_00670, partial [Flavobacteriales bacterium]